MPNSNTPHSRRCRAENAARWEAEKKAGGAKRVTVLLPPDDAARLDRLSVVHGTKTAAVVAALEMLESSASQPMVVSAPGRDADAH